MTRWIVGHTPAQDWRVHALVNDEVAVEANEARLSTAEAAYRLGITVRVSTSMKLDRSTPAVHPSDDGSHSLRLSTNGPVTSSRRVRLKRPPKDRCAFRGSHPSDTI